MDLGIAGKVALVTGASRGVGRAIAAALLREGARVMITARNAARLERTRAALEQETKDEVGAAAADLERDAEVKAMIDATVRRFGGIDILVNNAATVMPADFLALTDEAWLHVFEEKTNGYVRCLRHAIPVMKGRGWGRIVNVSGLGGRQPGSTTIPVGVNNAAVLNLTKSLAWLLAPDKILVNAVVPYIIDTDIQDETMARFAALTGKSEAEVRKERVAHIAVGRMGRPEEVADVVTFLASARTSYVTGAAWHVDGGAYRGI
jgi:3-oxoacyl-[acyl-carrier protein] reductase/bacilysin biosynthesis oxidoreductase BacG